MTSSRSSLSRSSCALARSIVTCKSQVTQAVRQTWEGEAMGLIDELEGTIKRLAGDVGPSVVGIGQRWGVGSGIVVEAGNVLTNAHNLRGDEVTVTFADGRTATGTPAGVDVDGDVAVVSVDTGDAKPVPWA